MNTLLPNYNITEYGADDCKAIETFGNILYAVIKEAIENDAAQTLMDELTNISDRQERVGNMLNIQDVENRKCFYFGYITALSSLGRDFAQSSTEESQMQDLLNSYPLLLPILEIIAEHDTISGIDLKKKTGQKSSSISNFMHRIAPFKLIHVSKIGTINYYSLTSKGRQLLEQYHQEKQEPPKEPQVPEELVLLILDELASQIGMDKPSSAPIMRKVISRSSYFKEKRLLKYKIESIFLCRDNYLRKYVGSCAISAKEDFESEEYEQWDDYYTDKEHEYTRLSEVSYV